MAPHVNRGRHQRCSNARLHDGVNYIELLVCVEDVPQTPEVQTQISAVTPTGAEM